MKPLAIFIPGVPLSANASGQWARFAANSNRQKFRKIAAALGRNVQIPDAWLPVQHTHITARRVAATRRRRDLLALAEQLKGPIDGLVDAGMMPDDDESHLRITLLPAVVEPRATPGILLLLEPIL